MKGGRVASLDIQPSSAAIVLRNPSSLDPILCEPNSADLLLMEIEIDKVLKTVRSSIVSQNATRQSNLLVIRVAKTSFTMVVSRFQMCRDLFKPKQ